MGNSNMIINQDIEFNKPSVKKIGDFINDFSDALRLPIYQRPYKWSEKHVNQLLNDIKEHFNKNNKDPICYRLGSIVLHYSDIQNGTQKGNIYNIVDGQQRIVTLILILKALSEFNKKNMIDTPFLQNVNKKIEYLITIFEFPSEISHHNIVKNYNMIKQKIIQNQFNQEHIHYLLENCEVAIFILDNIAEAFQFFDSQNARGKRLAPHDLLKAYHLREFRDNLLDTSNDISEKLLNQIVKKWEILIANTDGAKRMNLLFEKYLYRIRRWNKREKALTYTNDNVDIFKGINFKRNKDLPYVKALNTLYSKELNTGMKFNYQIDQPIINGYHFFEMIFEYYEKISEIEKLNIEGAKENLEHRKTYGRKGDKYTIDLFDTILLYYIDKFIDLTNPNKKHLKNAIDYFFFLVFRIRLENLRVDKDSIEKFIKDTRIIEKINFSLDGSDVINQEHKTLRPKSSHDNTKYFKHEFLLGRFEQRKLL